MRNSNIAIGLLEEYYGLDISKLEEAMKKWLALASEMPGYKFDKVIDEAYRYTLSDDIDFTNLVKEIDCGFAFVTGRLVEDYLKLKYPDVDYYIEVEDNQIFCTDFKQVSMPCNNMQEVMEAEQVLCLQTKPIRELIETCRLAEELQSEKLNFEPGTLDTVLDTVIRKNYKLDCYTVEEIQDKILQAFVQTYNEINEKNGCSLRITAKDDGTVSFFEESARQPDKKDSRLMN